MRRQSVTTSDWWEYQPGEHVQTVDGYPGVVDAVEDGPAAGMEVYLVTLDNGLGGGQYSPGMLEKMPGARQASGVHLAAEDYPELGDILDERPDPGKMTFTAALSEERQDAEDHDEPDGDDQPHSCSYCGGTEFTDQTDNGRVRQATCATCGGTMSAHPGAQWTPELIGDPSNHPSPAVDPRSGASGAGGVAGINDFIDFDSRVSTTAALAGHDWCTWRREARCTFPGDSTAVSLAIPQDRGPCPWETPWQQQVCPISEPGPMALMQAKGSKTLPEEVGSEAMIPAAQEAAMVRLSSQMRAVVEANRDRIQRIRRERAERSRSKDTRSAWDMLSPQKIPESERPKPRVAQPERLDDKHYTVGDVSRRYGWEGFDSHELSALHPEPHRATFTREDVPVHSLRIGTPESHGPVPTYHDMAGQDDSERERLEHVSEGHEQGAIPPIVVVRHGEHHLIADGAHRAAVAAHQGRSHIEAFVSDPYSDEHEDD